MGLAFKLSRTTGTPEKAHRFSTSMGTSTKLVVSSLQEVMALQVVTSIGSSRIQMDHCCAVSGLRYDYHVVLNSSLILYQLLGVARPSFFFN